MKIFGAGMAELNNGRSVQAADIGLGMRTRVSKPSRLNDDPKTVLDGPVDPKDLTATALCEGIFHRHASSIRIKKTHIAVPNLEQILLAALELGSRKGFHSMTTRDLAEKCGLSMGALYSYVGSKETFLRMILGAVADAVEQAIAPFEGAERSDARARLRGLIRRHIFVTEAMQRWFYFVFIEVKSFDKEARDLAIAKELRTEQLIADAIRAGMDQGLYSGGDPQILAGLVKPLLQDWYLKRWKFRKRGISPAQYVEIVTGFVERSLEYQPTRRATPRATAVRKSRTANR